MKKVKKQTAERVLLALERQHKAAIDAGYPRPSLVNGERSFFISWEEGPYEWAYLFPFGGIEEEFGFRVADVSGQVPKGLLIEPINSYSVGIYPE